MKSSAGSARRRTGGEERGWRGASEAGAAGGVVDGVAVLQQAEAGAELATLPASRAGGPGAEAPPGSLESLRQTPAVRVLIAIEDRHKVYREAIGGFLRATQPRLQVRLASSRGLHGELRRFGPQIVVHAGPAVPLPDLLPCWVELSLDPSVPTVFQTGRVRREVINPSIKHLMAVIAEAAQACS